jgi:hypothetical protein
MQNERFLGRALALLPASLLACGSAGSRAENSDTAGCATGDQGEPYELRCTGLYSDWASKTVAPGVRPYAPGVALWSDGAVKSRWIYLPPGTTIDTSDMDEWVFPVGTKLWKQFVVAGNLMETRMLWKRPAGWYRTTYRWSSDGQDTTELVTGELDAEGLGYYDVPTQKQCDECHAGQKDGVLGFSAISLSDPNATGLTLDVLAREGLVTAAPASPVVIPGSALDRGALEYLHINCGIACHNKDYGAASDTGFFMQLEVAQLESVQATDTWVTGVNQPSAFSPPGVVARIAPGNPSGSCIHYRMSQRNSPSAMPPVGSNVVDEAGLSIVGAWIESLDAGAGVDPTQ